MSELSRSSSFSGDVMGILFGEILGISQRDLLQQAVALAVVLAIARLFARPFLLLCFDPEQADIAGWPARRFELLMLVMVTVCVVMSFQTVGTLLVFGMLLAPAVLSALLANRVASMMAWGRGWVAWPCTSGCCAAYHFDLAQGGHRRRGGDHLLRGVHRAGHRPGLAGSPTGRGSHRRGGGVTGCEPSPPGPGAALRACALRIGYAGRPLIDGIDVRLEPGKALALVGVNGSGKSTLLKTFAGLLAPLAGTLEVLGSPSGTRPGPAGLPRAVPSGGRPAAAAECATSC
ncbi:MAG: iron chelate uptake ABC transporter family permease subunit [Acidimicrobiales bacterium]